MTTHERRFTIRELHFTDAGRLAALAESLFRETYATNHRPDDLDAYVAGAFGETVQTAELSAAGRWAVIAEGRDTMAIGYAQMRDASLPSTALREGARVVEISRFYVARPWHGQGVAQALMAACISEAAKREAAIWLAVWQENPRAIAFYEKSGFRRVGVRSFLLGREPERDDIMLRERG